MFLLDDLLLAPAKGLMFVFKKIHESVEEELTDTPEKLKKELIEAQMLQDLGQITEEYYKKREDNILQRLNALRPASPKLQRGEQAQGK